MNKKHDFFERLLTQQLIWRVLAVAAVAVMIIVFFVSGVNDPNPSWGQYWMVRPLVLVPLAGAGGGAVFHASRIIIRGEGLKNGLALLVGVLAYIVVLWMGIVIGLDGTLWN